MKGPPLRKEKGQYKWGNRRKKKKVKKGGELQSFKMEGGRIQAPRVH